MYTFGLICALLGIVTPWISAQRTIIKCYIDDNFNYIEFRSNSIINDFKLDAIIITLLVFFYFGWDLLTLILYIVKAYSFKRLKSDQTNVFKRIQLILCRIIILTLVYQFFVAWTQVGAVFYFATRGNRPTIIRKLIYHTIWVFLSMAMNFSIFLMQDHNTSEYMNLMELSRKFKLIYVCCCCKRIIIVELQEYKINTNVNTKRKEFTMTDKTLETGAKPLAIPDDNEESI